MSLYLRDATFIDWRTLAMKCAALRVDEGDDGAVVAVDEIPAGVTELDCAGKIVTRAFVNAHQHIYSALARGMPAPERTPSSFRELLELVWWKLDRKLDRDMIRASALASGIEALRTGCTFIIDHHSSPAAVEGSLGILAAALQEVGLGHLLCYELSDRDGAEVSDAGLQETARHLARHPGLVGLHASFTVSDELLARAVELAARLDSGIHIHVAEAESDQAHCRETYGTTVVERLARAGALSFPKTILAHCLHLDDIERRLVAESGAWVAQCHESNQNNAVGQFDPRDLGPRILFGTDGMHSDVLQSTRSAYLAGQSFGRSSPLAAYRRLRAAHDYLGSNGIAGAGENDLVVLDYPSPTPVTSGNWPAHVVYGLNSRHVHSVIRAGRLLVREGRVLTVDEDEVLGFAREQAERLWGRL
jgi:cytosine/adenosine deaminase-related metal-dependent hydrolase